MGLGASVNWLRNRNLERLRSREPERAPDLEYTQSTVGLTPFIRENDINFAAHSLKPENEANVFFDDIKVNNFSQRASYINVTSSSAFTNLRINEGLYAATSKAYAEVLGSSITATDNQVYLNDNFISIRIAKESGSSDLSTTEYAINDLVYQTADNIAFNFSLYAGVSQPNFAFLGKVKKWEYIDASNGVLVVEPILGTLNTSITNGARDRIFNLTRVSLTLREAAYVHSNNRFQAGETVSYASNGTAVLTIAAANAYVALSSAVTLSNTANSPIRSVVLSSNNITRDGISTIVGNTISIVSGTNMGFKANVVSVVANTAMGWNEAIVDATLPAHCTANSVYSIGNHRVNDVGAMYGIFHIPSESNLRWLTGERVFTITDTATYNDNAYKMRAIAKYTALGRVNTAENARNFVLAEQTPNTLRAPEKVTQASQKVNDRKYMAQTFYTPRGNSIQDGEIKNAYGIFVTSIDLFFKSKPSNSEELLPFTVAISKVESGLPANEIIASKTLEPAYINVSATTPSISNTSLATKFTFQDPVYLLPETEYAIKLITESGDYEVWTATLGGSYIDDVGNIRRISEQPYVGNFFKSQNASNWNPILNQDLMFRVNRASFSTQASQVNFQLAPIFTAQAIGISTNTVFDMVKLSSTEQQFSPTSISYAIKTKLTDGTETDYIAIDNNEIYNFGKDTNISSISSKRRRLIDYGNVASVNVRVTMQTSDDSVTPVLNQERFSIFTLENIINNAGIANNLITITNGGSHSNAANIAITISLPDVGSNRATANILPSMLSGGKITAVNIINPGSGYFSSPTITIAEQSASSNATAKVNGETDSSGGNILAKYQTKIVTLEDGFDAGDLVVRMDAVKPIGTDIAVYVKVLSALDSDPFVSKNWLRMSKVRDNSSPDQTKQVPLEFRYSFTKGTIEYFDGARVLPLGGTFKYFAVKVRMTAEDPTVVPFVESLKVVAVPGG